MPEKIDLPSQGIESGVKSIQLLPMTLGTFQALCEAKTSEWETATNKAVGACVGEKGANIGVVTVDDRTAMMLAIRIATYGSQTMFETKCPVCGASNIITCDLEKDVKARKLDSRYVKRPTVNLDGHGLTVHLLTAGDLEKAEGMAPVLGLPAWMARALMIVEAIDEQVVTPIDTLNFVKQENEMKRFAFLRQIIDKTDHGPDFTMQYKCTSCGETGKTEIPFRELFSLATVELNGDIEKGIFGGTETKL